jgi:hypothetical protein
MGDLEIATKNEGVRATDISTAMFLVRRADDPFWGRESGEDVGSRAIREMIRLCVKCAIR